LVRLANYGSLTSGDPRLWQVASTPGKACRVHWILASALQALQEAFSLPGVLLVASGWRKRRWRSRAHYEGVLKAKYQDRTDLACKRPPHAAKCPCMPHVRKSCLYLAFDSSHETGLAVDFGSHGMTPNTKTIAAQRKSEGYLWLVENAGRFGLENLPSEPWHWSLDCGREMWERPGPEAPGVGDPGWP